jgi:monofunctional biosynthetic peptidoglycan transglycosylase
MKHAGSSALRFLALLVLCGLALQAVFALRIALMAVVDPQSTSFQRSEVWRLLVEQHEVRWSQRWVDGTQISPHLKRAVIASEDAGFAEHSGVEWDALEKAWERNQKAEARVAKINERLEKQAAKSPSAADPRKLLRVPKVVGGSTITQQLAKNLFLAGERNLPRKAQEFIITFMLEALLNKQRILEIYLNNVEWGEGVFGADAAARHYFHIPAAQLSPTAAARLAVMLPAPKRFEKRPDSPYVVSRAATVAARMGAVDVP